MVTNQFREIHELMAQMKCEIKDARALIGADMKAFLQHSDRWNALISDSRRLQAARIRQPIPESEPVTQPFRTSGSTHTRYLNQSI